jgi:glucosamine 6-phosphate synthetase-like amidotransferase/phosphosugar isomerase protein
VKRSIALIDEHMPVVVIAQDKAIMMMIVSNIQD